jgi:hypothetical protein
LVLKREGGRKDIKEHLARATIHFKIILVKETIMFKNI